MEGAAHHRLQTFISCDILPGMAFAFASLALMAQAAKASPATIANFSRSYVVWIAPDHGPCTFFITDVGENANQLTETLRQNYDVTAGIEILFDGNTPGQ